MNTASSRRSFLRNIGLGSLGAIAANEMLDNALAQTRSGGESVWRSGHEDLGTFEEGMEARQRSEDSGGHRRQRRLQVRAVVRFSGSPERHGGGGQRLVSRPIRRNGESLPLRKDVSFTGRVSERRLDRGGVRGHRRAEPRQALHRSAQARKTRGQRSSGAFGSLDDAFKLYETVKSTGKKYMMFETSAFHEDCYAMREIYRAGGFGKLVYTEGEYFHYMPRTDSFVQGLADWLAAAILSHAFERLLLLRQRRQLHRSLVHGHAELDKGVTPDNNIYNNPFGTEIALFRTSEGGNGPHGRQLGHARHEGEMGRVRGQRGSMIGMNYMGEEKNLPDLEQTGFAAERRPGPSRRRFRLFDERVRHGDSRRPQAVGRHRHGVELDGFRHRGASIGVEGRRIHEDSAIHEYD